MRTVTFASVIAPVAVPGIAWGLANTGVSVLPHYLETQAFFGVGILLCLFDLPVFVLVARRPTTPPLLFPILGALLPMPVTLLITMLFGALADDAEMAQRMSLLSVVGITGAIAGGIAMAAAMYDRAIFNSSLHTDSQASE